MKVAARDSQLFLPSLWCRSWLFPGPANGQGAKAAPQHRLHLAEERIAAERPSPVRAAPKGTKVVRRRGLLQEFLPLLRAPSLAPGGEVEQTARSARRADVGRGTRPAVPPRPGRRGA